MTPWVVVNGDALVPMLDRVRESLPEVIRQSQRIVEKHDEILEDANRRAGRMLEDARQKADMMLSDSELLRAVHLEADRIRQSMIDELEAYRKKIYDEADQVKRDASEEAVRVREGTDRYAAAVLESLEKSLGEFHGTVRNAQQNLSSRRKQLDATQIDPLGRATTQAQRPEAPAATATEQPRGATGSTSVEEELRRRRQAHESLYGNEPRTESRVGASRSDLEPLYDRERQEDSLAALGLRDL